jgi:hypothetical protein
MQHEHSSSAGVIPATNNLPVCSDDSADLDFEDWLLGLRDEPISEEPLRLQDAVNVHETLMLSLAYSEGVPTSLPGLMDEGKVEFDTSCRCGRDLQTIYSTLTGKEDITVQDYFPVPTLREGSIPALFEQCADTVENYRTMVIVPDSKETGSQVRPYGCPETYSADSEDDTLRMATLEFTQWLEEPEIVATSSPGAITLGIDHPNVDCSVSGTSTDSFRKVGEEWVKARSVRLLGIAVSLLFPKERMNRGLCPRWNLGRLVLDENG